MTPTPQTTRHKPRLRGWVSIALVTFFGFIIFTLALSLAWQVLSPQGRVSCDDFPVWGDALDAYNQGAYYLDRDRDGVPCEETKT